MGAGESVPIPTIAKIDNTSTLQISNKVVNKTLQANTNTTTVDVSANQISKINARRTICWMCNGGVNVQQKIDGTFKIVSEISAEQAQDIETELESKLSQELANEIKGADLPDRTIITNNLKQDVSNIVKNVCSVENLNKVRMRFDFNQVSEIDISYATIKCTPKTTWYGSQSAGDEPCLKVNQDLSMNLMSDVITTQIQKQLAKTKSYSEAKSKVDNSIKQDNTRQLAAWAGAVCICCVILSVVMIAAYMYMQMGSDIRLKENIVKVDEYRGINIYEYNYIKGSPRIRGVMAHEIKDEYPEAVSVREDGMYKVNYFRIPLRCSIAG